MVPMYSCELGSPCSAALRNHSAAFAGSFATPSPVAYNTARLCWALTWPCTAAFSYHCAAISVLIQRGQIELCADQTAFGGLRKPGGGLLVAFRNAVAVLIHQSEIVFCCGIRLSGGFFKPICCGREVLRDFLAGVKHFAKP